MFFYDFAILISTTCALLAVGFSFYETYKKYSAQKKFIGELSKHKELTKLSEANRINKIRDLAEKTLKQEEKSSILEGVDQVSVKARGRFVKNLFQEAHLL